MGNMDRRKFIKDVSRITGGALVGGYLLDSMLFRVDQVQAAINANIFVAKNGTPAENIARVIDMRFGGIEKFIGSEDVVVINPNGQWPNQGASNCACIMGLVDLILARPGGFDGEILLTENTQGVAGFWDVSSSGLIRNGPYNFNDMIAHYQGGGHSNVSGARLARNQDDSSAWPVISGPTQGQGWVRTEWTDPVYDCLFYLPYPIFRSPYSNRLIDLKNGVYDNGYAGQPPLKFIKMPNLNNHGTGGEQDYAGVTSATKSFLGISELENNTQARFDDGHTNMHAYAAWRCINDKPQEAFLTGEAIAGWMNTCRKPDLFITTAEWVGWGSRTGDDATRVRTVGLCDDPVSLDYYMSKYVVWPLLPTQQYFNPDYNIATNSTRQTLNGCRSLGYGTVVESEMSAYVYDFDAPQTFRFEIDRMTKKFKEGQATQQDVLDLIEQYNAGK